MNLHRRGFLLGLGTALAAPAIVPYASLMPVKLVNWSDIDVYYIGNYFTPTDEFMAFLHQTITPALVHEFNGDWLTHAG